MQWMHFAPVGGGGSFGREDMGEFCEINSVLFIVSMFESAVSQTQMKDIDARVAECLKQTKLGEIYEWLNGTFTYQPTIDWREKLKQSSITY